MMRRLLTIIIFLSIMVPAMAQRLIHHPWEGKRVAYFGDSITDPNNNGSTLKLKLPDFMTPSVPVTS